jgi:hypothetical protein
MTLITYVFTFVFHAKFKKKKMMGTAATATTTSPATSVMLTLKQPLANTKTPQVSIKTMSATPSNPQDSQQPQPFDPLAYFEDFVQSI